MKEMIAESKRLMVLAGGTGGHVFSGLAVALHLIEKGWKVHWLGAPDRIESDLVPKYGIDIDFIDISGLRGKCIKTQLSTQFRIFKAVQKARVIIRRFNPNVILGMGGYVSGPGGIAAWLCGIPLVLHEQNRIAGLTNRWLSRIAKKVLQAFPGAFPNAEVVGNPLRRDVLALPRPIERLKGREGPLRVLVLGGSQGAQILNQITPQIASYLGNKIALWHQVGKGALEMVLNNYDRIDQSQHIITEFIDNIAIAYLWADVVICRSGALTVSEIAAVGLPAIFVPFQHQDRQQYWNARVLEEVGAAKIIEQEQLSAKLICDILNNLHRQILFDMAQKARKVAMPYSTDRVADALMRTVY